MCVCSNECMLSGSHFPADRFLSQFTSLEWLLKNSKAVTWSHLQTCFMQDLCKSVWGCVSVWGGFDIYTKLGANACVSNVLYPEKRCQHCAASVKKRLCGTREQPTKYFYAFRESCCVDRDLVDWLLVLGDPASSRPSVALLSAGVT